MRIFVFSFFSMKTLPSGLSNCVWYSLSIFFNSSINVSNSSFSLVIISSSSSLLPFFSRSFTLSTVMKSMYSWVSFSVANLGLGDPNAWRIQFISPPPYCTCLMFSIIPSICFCWVSDKFIDGGDAVCMSFCRELICSMIRETLPSWSTICDAFSSISLFFFSFCKIISFIILEKFSSSISAIISSKPSFRPLYISSHSSSIPRKENISSGS